jgi:hypothetical protein
VAKIQKTWCESFHGASEYDAAVEDAWNGRMVHRSRVSKVCQDGDPQSWDSPLTREWRTVALELGC